MFERWTHWPVGCSGRRMTARWRASLPVVAAFAVFGPGPAASGHAPTAAGGGFTDHAASPSSGVREDGPAVPRRGEADPESARIVARMVFELGGHDAWEETRYLTWRSFTGRRYLWDRHDERVRVETAWGKSAAPHVIVLDLAAGTGRAWRDEEEIVDPKRRSEVVQEARTWFAEDSFRLAMPYRLREPGVRIRGFGMAHMADGRPADLLEVTFPGAARGASAGAGTTEGDARLLLPTARYWIYVDRDTGLVGQWDIFTVPDATRADMTTPWSGWKRFGGIMLSEDRGEWRLSDIEVLDDVVDGAFDAPQSVDAFGISGTGD